MDTTVDVIEHNHISQNEQKKEHEEIHPHKPYHEAFKECQQEWHHYVHTLVGEDIPCKSHNVDFMNDILGDSTLNTDGKMQDAMFGTCPDQTIHSNASCDDSVQTNDTGLAGFDSRQSLLSLVFCKGEHNQIQYLGVVEHTVHYPDRKGGTHTIDKARYSHVIKIPVNHPAMNDGASDVFS